MAGVTAATWQCPACDTYNAAGAAACTVCETAKPAVPVKRPAPASRATPAKTPTPAKPAAPKSPAKKPAPTAKPAPGRDSVTSLASMRVSKDLAALLPELFHPDGTPRRDLTGTIGGTPSVDALARLLSGTPPEHLAAYVPTPAKRTAVPKRAAAPTPVRISRPTATTPELTPGETAFTCGCLLVIVGALITGIVMLVLHWGSVWDFVTRHHSSHPAAAAPTATVRPGTPCPKDVAALLPSGTADGSVLVAVYRSTDMDEEYAFCADHSGDVYYFGHTIGVAFAGAGHPATRISGGYRVAYADVSYEFRGTHLTGYVDGKKKSDDPIAPASSVGKGS